jgi:hypothetical protein
VKEGDEDIPVRAVQSPDDILLIVAGGVAGRFSACIPGWVSMKACRSVTKAISDVTCGA